MKLLFTDLDGTLLNSQKSISVNTRAVLDKWIKKGNRLILSSGRPLDSILEVKKLGNLNYPDMLIIASNGSLIYDCDKEKILYQTGVPFPYVKHIMDTAKKCGVHCHTYSDTHIICEGENEHLTYYMSRIHLPCIISDDVISELPHAPEKLLAIDIHDHEKLENLRQALLPWAEGKIQMLYSCNELLECIPYESGKGNALLKVCEILKVPVKNSYAAGDMNNDISMLQSAGVKIAMKNATPLLKEMADIVTEKDNDHDGLAETLLKFL